MSVNKAVVISRQLRDVLPLLAEGTLTLAAVTALVAVTVLSSGRRDPVVYVGLAMLLLNGGLWTWVRRTARSFPPLDRSASYGAFAELATALPAWATTLPVGS